MLDARHHPDPAAEVADALEHVERRADRRVADRVDLGMDARAGSPANKLLELLRFGHPDAPSPVRSERPLRLLLVILEQRRGPRREGAIGEQLQPAHPGLAVGARPERLAAADSSCECGLERIVADRHVDADRKAPCIGQARVCRERPRQVGVGRHAAGVVAGHDAERHELAGHGHDPGLDVRLAVKRDALR